ncbi:MAG TPA: haloacid dehalogenase type II [Chitinophagaceae bacterium]
MPIGDIKLVLLDVYGTLLDMGHVEKRVNELLNSKRGYVYWFELFMQYCFVDNCIDRFNDFNSIAKSTLQMSARTFRVSLTDEDISGIFELMKQLPIKNDVTKGLSKINDHRLRIAALTNSPEAIVIARMERTGLISFFEKVLSTEHVGKYKPDKSVYTWAAATLGLKPEEIIMVSIHDWDLAGAANAGMMTGFIQQNNQLFYPLISKPDFGSKNLNDFANQITASIDEFNSKSLLNV